MVATVGTDGVPIAVVAGESSRIALQSTHWLARVLGGTAGGWQVSVSIWRLGKASSTLVHSTHLTAATSPTTNLSQCVSHFSLSFVSPCLSAFLSPLLCFSAGCLSVLCLLLKVSTSRLLTGSGCAQVDTCRVAAATPGVHGCSRLAATDSGGRGAPTRLQLPNRCSFLLSCLGLVC